jgi:hypothetical protein
MSSADTMMNAGVGVLMSISVESFVVQGERIVSGGHAAVPFRTSHEW